MTLQELYIKEKNNISSPIHHYIIELFREYPNEQGELYIDYAESLDEMSKYFGSFWDCEVTYQGITLVPRFTSPCYVYKIVVRI